MDQQFWRAAAVTTLLLVSVTSVRVYERAAFAEPEENSGPLPTILQTLRNTGLNREDRERQTVGYYEGLLNEGSRVTSVGSLLTSQASRTDAASRRIRALRQPDKYIVTRDFLYYVPRPHLDIADYDDGVSRLVTNSVGMADREYATVKPAGTRRVAVLGDSVTRGQGAPHGQSFEALLEDALNDKHAEAGRFEVLNFAVSGYRLTQVLDVALEKVPRYAPDVYMLALTELSISGRWGDHLEQLVADGVDLKYDFLRDLVRRARLTADEGPGTADAKLAPYRMEIVRWAISTIRDHARAQGGSLIVLLVPTVRETASLKQDFRGLPELGWDLGVPVIDLLDTFADVPDPGAYRVSTENVHPNGAGHRRLFERLYEALTTGPLGEDLMRGSPPQPRPGR